MLSPPRVGCPETSLKWGLITGPTFFCQKSDPLHNVQAFNNTKMLWDQGLNPHSVLVTIGLALFIITRPGLSSQRYVAPPVDAKGQEIRYICYYFIPSLVILLPNPKFPAQLALEWSFILSWHGRY